MRSVPVEFNGEQKQLRFDFNAMAELEDHLGKGLAAIFREDNIGFRTVRAFYWAGLRWKDRGLTVERAGQLLQQKIDEGESFEGLMVPIMKALQLSGFMGREAKEKALTEEKEPTENPN